jgi:PAS domain S-box-containing protein
MSEALGLFGVAVFGNALTALLGAAVPALAFGAPFWRAWLLWLVADGLGMILIAPLIVAWSGGRDSFSSIAWRQWVEIVLQTVLIALFAQLLFGTFTVAARPILRVYMLFPILIWMAFYYRPRGMTAMLSMLAFIALWNTLQGHGIFSISEQGVIQRIMLTQVFLAVYAFSGLLLSAVITERKIAESQKEAAFKKLRESEEKYRTVADFTYDWEGWHAPYGAYLYLSPSCERITGYAAAEFLVDANLIVQITHPDDQPAVVDHFRTMTDQAKLDDGHLDFRVLTRGGETRWISHRCTAVHDENGKWLGRRESNRDITERKLAEDALRESEERYQRITEAITDYIYTVRVEDGRALETIHGPGCLAVTGYAVDEFEKDDYLWLRMVAEEDRPCVEEQARRILAGEDPPSIEHRIIHKNGGMIWVKNTFVLHRDERGALVSYDGLIQNITERKRAEEALRDSEAALKQAQRVARVGSWTWHIKENNLEWSDEMYRIFGYEKETFSGRLDEVMAQAIHPDDRAEVERSNASVMRDKKPIPLEYRVIRPDNTVRTVWAEAGQLILDEQGQPAILTGIVQDITERKRAENELRRSEEMLKDAQRLAHLGHWYWDVYGSTLTWSEEVFRIFDVDPEKYPVSAENFEKMIHPDDLAPFLTAREKMLAEETDTESGIASFVPAVKYAMCWNAPRY